MPELAVPTRYNIPILQQQFQPAPVRALEPNQRGLAKAKMWGSIAQAISELPNTLLQAYNAKREKTNEDQLLQERRNREALVAQKFQEASIPSAVAVQSPVNETLGIEAGTAGGGPLKPALADFSISPTGMSYQPEDPALRKAKAEYYSGRALAGFGEAEGITFANAKAAMDAGYDPEGGKVHSDGTITVSKYKPSGMDARGRAKLTDTQKTKLDSAAQLAASIDGLMEDYDELEGKDMAGPIMGRVEKLKQRMGFGSEEGSRIQAEMNTALFRIARMLNGAGVLTDKDIARAEGVAPTITMERGQFKGQLDAVKTVIKEGLETWMQTNAGQATDEQIALANKAIASLGGKKSVAVEENPSQQAAQPKADPNGMVQVISPDGKSGRIPASQVEEALKEGYKLR